MRAGVHGSSSQFRSQAMASSSSDEEGFLPALPLGPPASHGDRLSVRAAASSGVSSDSDDSFLHVDRVAEVATDILAVSAARLQPPAEALVQPLVVFQPQIAPPSRLRACLSGVTGADRTDAQHIAMTSHMRMKKAEKKLECFKATQSAVVMKLADTLKHSALRIDSVVSAKLSTLVIRQSRSNDVLSAYAWMRVSFDDILLPDRALARKFNIDGGTVRTSLALMVD
jgi:hypothetical protein